MQDGSGLYEIHVRGCVHPDSGWFDGMQVTLLEDGETLISGMLPDQAALHGLLMRNRDLNLPLIKVSRLPPEGKAGCSDCGTEEGRYGKETNK